MATCSALAHHGNHAATVILAASVSSDRLWSISPTFYEQLLRQYSFTKKITKPNCK